MSNMIPQHSNSNRFSREGFKPIPPAYGSNMGNNDATIDIPLEQVTANGGGLRSQGSTTALRVNGNAEQNEKSRWGFRGRRQKAPPVQKKGSFGYDSEEETVNTLGKVYQSVRDFSVLTRYFLYVTPLAAIIAVPIVIGAVVEPVKGSQIDKSPNIGGVPILWFFTWVEIVWFSLWVSKAVAHYLPKIFEVFAGVVSSGVRKYSMVIRSLEIPLSLVGWAVTSLATFEPLMTRNPNNIAACEALKNKTGATNCGKNWINIVQKLLAAAVIASVVYLVEKTFIQLLSISYHRKQFNSRIKESKRNVWMLGLLYEASRTLFPMFCQEFAEEDYVIADQLNLSRGVTSKGRSHHRSGSHTPMRVLQDIGHGVDKLTSMFGNVASEVTGKNVFNPNSAHSIVVEALEKNRTAEALARRIWMSFVAEGQEALMQDDVVDVLGPDRKTEAEEAFWVLDADMNGDVSLDEMIQTVTEFGRVRKSIASSIHDVDEAINVLDRMLVVVVLIIIVLVFVAFLDQSFVSTLATTGTALLSLSFIFSTSAQEVLGSCIFLFVKHPFDIGDRVDIGTSGTANQENFVVEHISLLFTVFRHVEGTSVGRLCQIPNIVLNTLWVGNVSRSKAMTEQLIIDISFDTSFDDLQILKNELLTFITDKENSRDFQPNVDLDVLGTSDQSKLSLLVEVKHKSNWANESIRRSRRSKFMCALVSALRALPIYPPGGGCDVQGSAALPAYSVAISHAEAKEHAGEAAKGREKARLVAKKIEEPKDRLSPAGSRDNKYGTGITQRENQIIDDLTNRDPAVDPARDEGWVSRDDSSTLGERPSIDRQEAEDIKGVLRRESTRGKRKPGSDYQPTIPTIKEPESYQFSYDNFVQEGQASGYENQRPGGYSTTPTTYRPTVRPQAAQYHPVQSQSPTIAQSVEMGQIPAPAQRSPSNPYRSQQNEQLQAPGDTEDDWANTRPYSGV